MMDFFLFNLILFYILLHILSRSIFMDSNVKLNSCVGMAV